MQKSILTYEFFEFFASLSIALMDNEKFFRVGSLMVNSISIMKLEVRTLILTDGDSSYYYQLKKTSELEAETRSEIY